jgi:hypothetical protein
MFEVGKVADRFAPFTLVGKVIRLVPLRTEHASLFWESGKNTHEEIFRWFPMRMENREDFQRLRRLGAQEEGTLRKHMATHNGRQRDSVYFSIIDSEWPSVKARLEGLFNR